MQARPSGWWVLALIRHTCIEMEFKYLSIGIQVPPERCLWYSVLDHTRNCMVNYTHVHFIAVSHKLLHMLLVDIVYVMVLENLTPFLIGTVEQSLHVCMKSIIHLHVVIKVYKTTEFPLIFGRATLSEFHLENWTSSCSCVQILWLMCSKGLRYSRPCYHAIWGTRLSWWKSKL